MVLLMVGMSLLFLWCGFMPDSAFAKDGVFVRLIVKYVAPPMALLAIYAVVFQNVLRKAFVEVDRDRIVVRYLFGTKTVLWDDVLDISTYTLNHNEFVGFATKDKLAKNLERGFWGSILSSMGGNYGVSIPLKQISNHDKDQVVIWLKTIFENRQAEQEMSGEFPVEAEVAYASIDEEYDATPGKLSLALLYSGAYAVALGVVYALSIFILETNLLFIPVIGVIGINYYFVRHLKPSRYSPWFRLYNGALGLASILIARITLIFLGSGMLPTPANLFEVTSQYLAYLLANPWNEGHFIIVGLATAAVGIFASGPSIPFFRKFIRPFLRRNGQFLYKREKPYFTIYLVPPEGFDEDQDKSTFRITKGCEIETLDGELKYFRIPKSFLDERKIRFPSDHLALSNDGTFIELPFGGVGSTTAYAYDCYLVADQSLHLEAIKLEIH